MTNLYSVLVRPLVTEKSNRQKATGKYAFVVSDEATRTTVKDAIETLFGVTVSDVNVLNAPAKRGRSKSRRTIVRRAGFKKAIVTLAVGSKPLSIFEGVQ